MKNMTGPKKGKNRFTINMWMLLNKQVLNRQSTACAQNGAATIKCLGQDVHQSVVFQKIPNKSSLSINGRTSQRKSYSAIHASGEKWRGPILCYTRATAANTCGWVPATWAILPGTWLKYLSKTNSSVKRTTNTWCNIQRIGHPVLINNQRNYTSSVKSTFLNVCLFLSKRKQLNLKSALKSKRFACVLKIYHTNGYSYTFIINLWFWVTMINYERIPSVFHSPIFPACSINRAEVQIRVQQQQLGRCWEVFLDSCTGSYIPPHTSRCHKQYFNISNFNPRFLACVNFKIKFRSCILAAS